MAGLKVTPPRVAILHAFKKEHVPLSAQELFEAVSREGVDMATVYRTIKTLEEAGIIRRVDIRKEALCYELAEGHHHHIVCTDCGRIEDVHECHIGELVKKIVSQSKGFKNVTEHTFELFGICKDCS